MENINNSLLLSKSSVYISINRTIFTISGLSIAAMGSSALINKKKNNILIVKIVAILILLCGIIYGFNNIIDYKNFINKNKNSINNSLLDISFVNNDINIMITTLILLVIILLCSIYSLIN